MPRKIVIPAAILLVLVIFFILKLSGGSNKVSLSYEETSPQYDLPDSVALSVFVENSGSMDAYMIPGSNLKDAVFDLVSDLSLQTDHLSLNYINSRVIPYNGDLESFIKNLTPASFAKAGGDRSNTDLRSMLREVISHQDAHTVTLFISDCILDISGNASDFFGNTLVSVKNTFREAIAGNPGLGVRILKMESNFEGNWYSGQNKEYLEGVKRPYYIWIMGDKHLLANLEKKVPVSDILGGVKEYAAFVTPEKIAFATDKDTYVIGHSNEITIDVKATLLSSLQEEAVLTNTEYYTASDDEKVKVEAVRPITDEASKYSHVLHLVVTNPEKVGKQTITVSYPALPDWVEASNNDTGSDVRNNLDKTTGIKYLIGGVAEAYENAKDYGQITFKLSNR